MFLQFLTLCALFSFLANARYGSGYVNRYLVVNSYTVVNTIHVSCYSTGASCNVTYAPQGRSSAEIDVGTVPANGTKEFDINVPLGARFYSDYQIGIRAVSDDKATYSAYLPRPPIAGTKFTQYFVFNPLYQREEYLLSCNIVALTDAADLTYLIGSDATKLSIPSYELKQFNISLLEQERTRIRVQSNSSVIVSCMIDNAYLTTWEPISNEPLFYSKFTGHTTISLADCETNQPISNFSKLKIESFTTSDCIDVDDLPLNENKIVRGNCNLMLTPLDTSTCVSMTAFAINGEFSDVGIPKSKQIWRLSETSNGRVFDVYSLTKINCEYIFNEAPTGDLVDNVLQGNVSTEMYSQSSSPFIDFIWINCNQPVHFRSLLGTDRSLLEFGYQSEKVWEPFFSAEARASAAGVRLDVFSSKLKLACVALFWFYLRHQ